MNLTAAKSAGLPALLPLLLTAALLLLVPARPAAATLPPGFVEVTLASDVPQAAGFAFLPDGRAFLVRKNGIVDLVTPYATHTPIDTIPGVYTLGEAGLTGVAVDPGWPLTPFVYFFYSQASPRMNVVERYRATGSLTNNVLVDMQLGEPYRILNLPDIMSNHNGGCLRFDSDGRLLVSHGDDVRSCVAQDRSTRNGCLMRLDLSALPGTGGGPPPEALLVPPDNPFASDTTGAALVISYGLRNPYRFSFDPVNDRSYVGDVGGNAWEEIDEVAGTGENFGWPILEADSPTGVSCGPITGPFEPPIIRYYHDPNDSTGPPNFFAVVCGPVYRDNPGRYAFPAAYDGVLFYGDHGKGWIRLAKFDGQEWVPFTVAGQADSLNWALGYARVTDIQRGADGAIYLTTLIGRFVRILYPGAPSAVPPPDATVHARVMPNPFRVGSGFALLETAETNVTETTVFDLSGRVVRRLSSPRWDGYDGAGTAATPGVYWIVAGNSIGRVVVVR